MVKKRLNNKGYMLVEIIMAFALAFGLVYFLLDLTIDLKNKNDDLLVTTLVSTDQAIITNLIMKELVKNSQDFKCEDIKLENNVFEFNGKENIISKYAVAEYNKDDDRYCKIENNSITINIPITVKQLQHDKNFDVNINYAISYNNETGENVEEDITENE